MSTTVVDITVERTRAVTVVFDDGVACEFPLAELRAACPCATCRGRRDAGSPAWSGRPEDLSIADAQLAGAWGLSIRWHDGHDTGIYPWDALRQWYEGDTQGVAE